MILVLLISILAPLWNRSSITETDDDSPSLSPPPPDPSVSLDFLTSLLLQSDSIRQNSNGGGLQYDFYRDTCPDAEEIVRRSMARIHTQHPEVSAALLRLMFHDCFIQVSSTSSLSFFNSLACGFSFFCLLLPVFSNILSVDRRSRFLCNHLMLQVLDFSCSYSI